MLLYVNKVRLDNFYVNKKMGKEFTTKYGGCWRGKYPLGSKQYTLQEEAELHQIEKVLTYQNDFCIAK